MAGDERSALVAGVGMIPFGKPGKSPPYDEMGTAAIRLAIEDAGIGFDLIEQAYAGFVYGDTSSGQKVIYKAGMTGIPIVNVNNACASGSTALYLARQAVESGAAECALAVGFEQMVPGALGLVFSDRPSPVADFNVICDELVDGEVPLAPKFYCGAGKEHMDRYGTTLADFAKVRAKASRHGARNPLSVFRNVLTEEEVLESPPILPGIMTRLMACPPTCGAAAAILVSPDFAKRHGLDPTVRIVAQAMTTDLPNSFDPPDMINLVGSDMTRRAADAVYEKAGIGPDDIQVVELHDCFAQNEVLTYEALGLCPPGGAQRFIADGDNSYGGKVVTNPSGGLLSKGHPLGATGLAQIFELTHQLRGTADRRQVDNVRYALQHNIGLGGACVVTLYECAR
ncbi:lipid-transfer protein [Sphingosinicella rhizophila]|uniref:propanoyl-CoA C-acyltransferase n=1 Tax=Sphingosinicella rhizophila TaxID=3050082 RepID=A0ABU3Q5R4_9SPHN|nr:lipid-transfer protein [Sphingosinicella sp. GR2756]MDT9598745.1 lipid-transfer protein [Sphingosinicella sp. GR2756]